MKIVLDLLVPVLPMDYRRAGLSFLKGVFAIVDKDLYEEYYVEKKFRKKPFTFTMDFKAKSFGEFLFPDNEHVRFTLATSDERVAGALINWSTLDRAVETFLSHGVRTSFIPEKTRIVPETFSEDVLIKDFVLPKKFLELKYPERFRGIPFEEQVRRYINDQGYDFEEMKLKSKTTVYGMEGKVIPQFVCHDLYLKGVKGDLKKLYTEGIGQYKSQGFGCPVPLNGEKE